MSTKEDDDATKEVLDYQAQARQVAADFRELDCECKWCERTTTGTKVNSISLLNEQVAFHNNISQVAFHNNISQVVFFQTSHRSQRGSRRDGHERKRVGWFSMRDGGNVERMPV